MVLQACVDAGPDICALYESTPQKIHARLDYIFNSLKRRPLPVSNMVNGTYKQYGLVDYKLARTVLLLLLYLPYGRGGVHAAPYVMNALAAVERGDGLLLSQLAGLVPTPFTFDCDAPDKPNTAVVTPDATFAIACGDGAVLNDTVEDLQLRFDSMARYSGFADVWPIRSFCSLSTLSMVAR